jgi:large subunit ribosomal protein L24
MDIKKGDTVYVLAGKSRTARLSAEERERTPITELKKVAEHHPGHRGRVLRALPAQGKVVVEGVNLVTKHSRRGRPGRVQAQQAGRVQQPSPMPVNKVMLVCPHCERPTRVRREIRNDSSVRICRQCNQMVDQPK